MLDKILNTLKYGNPRTKRILYRLFGVLLVGIILAITAVFLGSAVLGILSAALIFIDGLMLFNTSFEQKEVHINEEETEEDIIRNPLLQYNEVKLKKLMHAYKVKKEHVPVLIDLCTAEKVVQCPAYVWKDKTYLYVLMLDREPRMVKTPWRELDGIHIRRGMTARPEEEYENLKESTVLQLIFGGLLPKYYEKEISPYRKEYRKNQYSVAPGVWCTSASVPGLLKLLPEKFILEDGKYNEESQYFQEVYNARILYWDSVYNGEQYKKRVLEVLNSLRHSELSEDTIQGYLWMMMQKGLIPKEYADYVLSKRK